MGVFTCTAVAPGAGLERRPFWSVIRGYHVYKSIWTPALGEKLSTDQERGNPEDRYAVSVLKSSTIVGHVPREISKLCWMFISREGHIYRTV